MLGAVAQLNDVVEALLGELAEVEDAEVSRADAADALRQLERARERLEAGIGGVLSDLEARGFHAHEAAYSMANWLTAKTGASRSRAGSRVHLARKLRSMPETNAALLAGEITACHARVLTRALNPRTVEVFARDEGMLVAQAKQLTADQVVRVVEFWLRHADVDGAEPRVEGEDDRFYLSNTADGRLKGEFDIGGSLAITVKAAIDELVAQIRRRDVRNREIDPLDPGLDQTTAQRRARALGELCERAAASTENPAARKPLFSMITTVDTLAGRGDPSDWISEMEQAWTGPIPAFETHLWSCDCWLADIVIRNSDGEVLDAGRELRTANRAMRRALAARDGTHCAAPGCDRPAGWCDAHHIVHWEDGGHTTIDNLVLLCRWHHRQIHLDQLRVELIDGHPRFTNQADMTLLAPAEPTEPPGDPPTVTAA